MLGLGLGLHRGIFKSAVSYVSNLIKVFKARVILDGGIFEAQNCLKTTLDNLDSLGLLTKASLIVTPNAVKDNILYSVIPNTTLGDITVVRNTIATRVNENGLIETVGANIARLDYSNGCPNILVEPQRTNGYLYSEQFDLWDTVINAVITSNYTISPDGTQNADRYLATGNGFIFVGNGKSNGLSTISVWAKRNNSGTERFGFFVNGDGNIAYEFNLTSQWQRFTYQVNVTNLYQGLAADIGADVSIWGMQLEMGSYATSYIPTVASTVTRNADVISKTGISTLIGQTEGTLFLNVAALNDDGTDRDFELSDGTSDNLIKIRFSRFTSYIGFFIVRNGIEQFGTLIIGNNQTNFNKIAIKYKLNDISAWINGSKVAFTTTATIPNTSIIEFSANGADKFYSKVKEIELYKTALTDTECINLTTL